MCILGGSRYYDQIFQSIYFDVVTLVQVRRLQLSARVETCVDAQE